ncbi:hypothetical protein FRB97_001375 [Tulasnella sp. 331]|nr:hypothetical protein FRB97_001375 [Tulasnella sp. 331]KAG8886326.1 hypothetical protein FRB98_001311 [Tulasnella sp. 332]
MSQTNPPSSNATTIATTTIPIPQPPALPLLGNTQDVDPELPNSSLQRIIAQYGPIVKMAMLRRNLIVVGSQELVHELCDEKRFEKQVGGGLQNVRAITGDGMRILRKAVTAIAHRVLMPAFGPLSIQGMFPGMVDIAGQLVAKWERFADHKINVVADFTNLTLDTIAFCTFSYRFNSFYSTEPQPFVQAMGRSLKVAGSRTRRLPMTGFLYHKEDQIFAEDVKLQHDTADEIIQKRIDNPTDDKDLLNTMLKGKDPVTGQGLSPENIRSNMVTFLIAGHETTSGMLTFLFYYVLSTPRAYQAIRTEVDTVCGREPISLSHLPKLKYIDAALKEALRLNPTAGAWTVTPKADEIIGGKYAVSKGQPITVVLAALHRDPKVWGDDVEEFRKWYARLFQKFDFRPYDPGYQLKVKSTLTIKPVDFYMRVAVRKDAAPIAVQVQTAHEEVKPTAQLTPAPTPQGCPLHVLYGSNSGTCEAFARQFLAESTRHGCKGTIGHLNEYPSGGLPKDGPVVIVTASYEGQPTDDACHFVEWLKTADAASCKGVSYAVFGCGHPDWATTFMAIPTLLDERLSACSGTRLVDRGLGNAAGPNLPGEFEEWSKKFWTIMSDSGRIGSQPEESSLQLSARVDSSYRTTVLRNKHLSAAKVLSTKVLTKDGAPIKRHIEIDLGEEATYRAGDYLAILPANPMDTVTRAIRRLGLHADDVVELTSSGDSSESTLPIGKQMSAFDMLAGFVELDQPATLKNVRFLANLVKDDESEKAALDRLMTTEVYEEEVGKSRISLLRLMEDHPSIKVPLAPFLQELLPIRVRQYSISSSPLWKPNVVTLTVGILDAPHLSGKGRYVGLASSFLDRLSQGSLIRVTIKPSHVAFHLPPDPSVPILMFGAGTGVAPFRGFVQERAIQKAAGRAVGPALLFYGCRAKEEDLLYDEEMEAWAAEGVVSVRHAFSKKPEESSDCKYVQDRLYHDREEVRTLFDQAGARVYICGSPSMARGIEEVCIKIASEAAGKSEEEAKAWFKRIQAERFATDVYA